MATSKFLPWHFVHENVVYLNYAGCEKITMTAMSKHDVKTSTSTFRKFVLSHLTERCDAYKMRKPKTMTMVLPRCGDEIAQNEHWVSFLTYWEKLVSSIVLYSRLYWNGVLGFSNCKHCLCSVATIRLKEEQKRSLNCVFSKVATEVFTVRFHPSFSLSFSCCVQPSGFLR